MATTLSLGFDPIWSNFDLYGVSAGGASLYSYDSLNPSVEKFIFQDPGGNFPYPNPILFDENGNAPGPFYFVFDSLDPTSLYDLFLYDANGNLIWNVNGYYPSGSGGAVVNTSIDIDNLLTNGVLWRNLGGVETSLAPTPIPITVTETDIAPSIHDGLSFNVAPTPSITGGPTANYFGPDIQFLRSNNSATESVSFPAFPLGSTQFSSENDTTPIQYLNHRVTVAGAAETYRYYQFPVSAKVQSLSNEDVTISIWGQAVGSPVNLVLSWAQFYGDGTAATGTVKTVISTFATTTSWTKHVVSTTVPNVAGNVIGTCGNDGLFLLVELPLTQTFQVNFTKLSLYMGSIEPTQEFILYDEIDSVTNTARTGDVRIALNNFGRQSASNGWVPMNDGTIGSPASAATTRAKTDTFPLYNLIWNNVLNQFAPVTGGRGASAIADFDANKSLQLTKALGRVLAGTSQPVTNTTATVVSTNTLTVTTPLGLNFHLAAPVAFNPAPVGLSINVTYYAFLITATTFAVASTPENAILGIPVPIAIQPGIFTVQTPDFILGEFRGEETSTAVVAHTHDQPAGGAYVLTGAGAGVTIGGPAAVDISAITGPVTGGGSSSFSLVQPTTYMNFFIKL